MIYVVYSILVPVTPQLVYRGQELILLVSESSDI
jgi:hypothetical protein